MRPCERLQSKPFSSTILESRSSSENYKSHSEQVALESTQAIESKQTQCDSKIVEKNAENVFGSQLVGGRIFLKKHRLTPSGIPCFDEKAGLCSGEQGDKTCGLSPQGDTNSLLYRKKPTPKPSQAKTFLTLGIIFNLCLLGIFKYTDFFLENFNLFTKLLHLDFAIPLPHILLPLALSFVTFQQIAFLVDCYKQAKEREEAKKLESNGEDNRESKSQHSLTQATLSTTTAKEKRFIPSPLPLAQKSKATAFLFCNQGESLAISASSTQAAIGTTAYRQSAFAHHEAGENRCAFGTPNDLDSASAESKKPTPKTNNEIPHINFLDYCLFITFFPQLIAGPIVHHREMMPQFYKMSRRDSALGEQCGSVVDFCKGTNTKFANLYKNPQSSHSPTAKQGIPLGDSRCFFRNLRILEEEKQAQNLHKQPNNSRIFTQEVQNVAKSQAEAKVDSSKSLSDSKIVEKNAENVFCSHATRRQDFGDRIVALQEQTWAHTKAYVTAGSPQQSAILAQNKRSAVSLEKPTPNLINWEYIAKGLFIFSIGLFKKVVIADSFAKWANAGFGAVENGAVLNCLESWATSLSYTFELYFDFSGYCDMAIGLGLLFGIVLPINFSSPYKALNIATFWRNWHITLGRFLKEYLYIPLGGNQNLAYRQSRFYVALNNLLTLRNLFIVAFLSGVWHGAGWGFVIWGSLHGVAMVVHRIYMLFYKKLDSASLYVRFMQTRIYILLCWILTFNFINIAWVFFRAENLQGAVNLLKGMFFGEVVWLRLMDSGTVSTNSIEVWGWIFLAFILALACKNSIALSAHISKVRIIFAGVGCAICLLKIIGDSGASSPFLYFNF